MGESRLDEIHVLVYRAALQHPGASLTDLAESTGRTADDLDKPVAELVDMGLLRGDESGLTARSPLLAEATTLGAEELDLNARRAVVERRRSAIRGLAAEWNAAFDVRPDAGNVDVVDDPAEVAGVLMHFAERCERELLSLAPGRVPAGRADGRTRAANGYSAARGIRTRAVYQHGALRDSATRAYLHELAGTGARIRLAVSVPGRCLVVDGTVALLPIPTGGAGRSGLAVVREPSVVAWVVSAFEQLWAEATPLADAAERVPLDEPDETRLAILRLMAEGEKDEAIARRLSISVRTCRRHIADYLAQVGAASRFQAGVIAARAGHLDVPLPGPAG